VKTFVCLICAAVLALPTLERAGEAVAGLQEELRRNLTCTAATYAALETDAAEADFARAEALCAKTY
jgi:siderophore synthetase component